jgi:hypothetical protein
MAAIGCRIAVAIVGGAGGPTRLESNSAITMVTGAAV